MSDTETGCAGAAWEPHPYTPSALIQPSVGMVPSAAVTPPGRRGMADPSRMSDAGRIAALKSHAVAHVGKYYPPWIKRVLINECEVLGLYLWEMNPAGIIRTFEEIMSWPPLEVREAVQEAVKAQIEADRLAEKERRAAQPDPGDLTKYLDEAA